MPDDIATEATVWPAGCRIERWYDEAVFTARFQDHATYHAALRQTVLGMADDQTAATRFSGEVGSVKLYDIDRWGTPEATLVHQRALRMFRQVSGRAEAAVDLSWGSVYYKGDWCMPHSHPRTQASVLYVLDLGDEAAVAGGQFCFADPRMKMCCREEAGYVSTPSAPPLAAGTMLLFPGQAVHFVTPYRGDRPRLTMSWNINQQAKPGDPLPKGVHRPDRE